MNYLEAANEVLEIFKKLGIPYALIGGIAVGAWSEERMTKDVDFKISMTPDQWSQLEQSLKQDLGAEIFQVSSDFGEVLPYLVRLKHKEVIIDLLTALEPFQKELIGRRVSTNVGGYIMDVAKAEDIIILKLLAKRPQDLVDIKKIIAFRKELDLNHISKWAQIWEMSPLWEQIRQEAGL